MNEKVSVRFEVCSGPEVVSSTVVARCDLCFITSAWQFSFVSCSSIPFDLVFVVYVGADAWVVKWSLESLRRVLGERLELCSVS